MCRNQSKEVKLSQYAIVDAEDSLRLKMAPFSHKFDTPYLRFILFYVVMPDVIVVSLLPTMEVVYGILFEQDVLGSWAARVAVVSRTRYRTLRRHRLQYL